MPLILSLSLAHLFWRTVWSVWNICTQHAINPHGEDIRGCHEGTSERAGERGLAINYGMWTCVWFMSLIRLLWMSADEPVLSAASQVNHSDPELTNKHIADFLHWLALLFLHMQQYFSRDGSLVNTRLNKLRWVESFVSQKRMSGNWLCCFKCLSWNAV